MTTDLPTGYEWCTTHSRNKRHISNNLKTSERTHPRGRSGHTLCGYSADDEERSNYWLDMWGSGKTINVMDLSPCVPCTRKAAKANTVGEAGQ